MSVSRELSSESRTLCREDRILPTPFSIITHNGAAFVSFRLQDTVLLRWRLIGRMVLLSWRLGGGLESARLQEVLMDDGGVVWIAFWYCIARRRVSL